MGCRKEWGMATPYAKKFQSRKAELLEIAHRRGEMGLSFYMHQKYGVAGHPPAVRKMLIEFTGDPDFPKKLYARRDGVTPADFVEAAVEANSKLKEIIRRQAKEIEWLKERLEEKEGISHAKVEWGMREIQAP